MLLTSSRLLVSIWMLNMWMEWLLLICTVIRYSNSTVGKSLKRLTVKTMRPLLTMAMPLAILMPNNLGDWMPLKYKYRKTSCQSLIQVCEWLEALTRTAAQNVFLVSRSASSPARGKRRRRCSARLLSRSVCTLASVSDARIRVMHENSWRIQTRDIQASFCPKIHRLY